jgi:threonine dehydratase
VDLDEVSPFVDGAAVRRVGTLTHAAVAATGTHLTSVSEGALCVEMLAMYQTDGIIAEPAGALATTVLADLRIEPGSTVVAVVSGGNNDVSRYAEIVERALVHEGRKHYFTVDFPQEPGALRRFLDEVLGPDDDITFFDYIKRNNRDTGTAIVGLELGDPDELGPLLARMDASPLRIERIPTDSPLFRLIG